MIATITTITTFIGCICAWLIYYGCCTDRLVYDVFKREIAQYKALRFLISICVIFSFLFSLPWIFVLCLGSYIALNGSIKEVEGK